MRNDAAPDRLAEAADFFDLTVIGGGALGCAVAWEASSRGIRTALLESDDFGWATSANSLRIVHGGLRYLQKMDLRRARRSAGERSALLRIAPHLVEPLRCAIPTFPSWTRGKAALGAGLALNALLTMDRNRRIDPERHLSAGGLVPLEDISALAPGIPTGGWSGGADWYDAMMVDSERLCLAFAMSARKTGARILNHAEAVDIRRTGQHENTVLVRDRLTANTADLRTRLVVDCRGCTALANSNATATNMTPAASDACVKAVNLVLDAPSTGCALGFPARDTHGQPVAGRLFFAVPYHGSLAVGTWYFPFDPAQSALAPTPAEMNEIFSDLRASTDWQLDNTRVRAIHAGLLPRNPNVPKPAPADRPQVFRERDSTDRYGLWRVSTEKWTTVRYLAEKAIDTIASQDKLSVERSQTRWLPLYGAEFENLTKLRDEARSVAPRGVDQSIVERLLKRYGANAISILHQLGAWPELADTMPNFPAVTRAEVAYSTTEEMTYTLSDLVLRRLGLGSTGRPPPDSLSFAADIIGAQRGWSDRDRTTNIESVQDYGGFPVI